MVPSDLARSGAGSADAQTRYLVVAEARSREARRLCACGCRRKATHLGCADGVVLMSGCELRVRRWVRQGTAGFRLLARARDVAGAAEDVGAARQGSHEAVAERGDPSLSVLLDVAKALGYRLVAEPVAAE